MRAFMVSLYWGSWKVKMGLKKKHHAEPPDGASGPATSANWLLTHTKICQVFLLMYQQTIYDVDAWCMWSYCALDKPKNTNTLLTFLANY